MLEVIITKEELYDKCENVEQLYDGFYYPLLVEYKELKKQLEVLEQENQKYKEVINKAINNSQYWIDYYTRLNSDERIALRLQENIDILKEVE